MGQTEASRGILWYNTAYLYKEMKRDSCGIGAKNYNKTLFFCQQEVFLERETVLQSKIIVHKAELGT
jgi:hypothetical protein